MTSRTIFVSLMLLSLGSIWIALGYSNKNREYKNKNREYKRFLRKKIKETERLQREISEIFNEINRDICVQYMDIDPDNRDFSAGWNSALDSIQYKVQRIEKEVSASTKL